MNERSALVVSVNAIVDYICSCFMNSVYCLRAGLSLAVIFTAFGEEREVGCENLLSFYYVSNISCLIHLI